MTAGADNVKQLQDEHFKPPLRNVQAKHLRIRRKYPAIQIPPWGWIKILAASVILGCMCYALMIVWAYQVTAHTMQTSHATFMEPWKSGLSAATAAGITLDDLGITGDDALKNELIDAQKDPDAPTAPTATNDPKRASKSQPAAAVDPQSVPTFDLALRLVKAGSPGSCNTCQSDCDEAFRATVIRMLLGWPVGATAQQADVCYIHQTIDGEGSCGPAPAGAAPPPSQSEKDAACRDVHRDSSLRPSPFSWYLIAGRQEPWPAPLVAQLVMGADKCVSTGGQSLDHDRCTLVTRLFQTVIDDADVKYDRAFLIDFFYGWERTLVFVLFFVVLLALWRQRRARKRLEIEAQWVQESIAAPDLRSGLDPIDPRTTIAAAGAALALKNGFNAAFTPKLDGSASEPVAEIVGATAEAVTQGDIEYMKTFVDRNLQEMERSRELINSIITIFPVIGFSATLLSLVHALAGANQIATASGDARSAAILYVTSLLSSCFATTFLALVCMAVFIVVNILAGAADSRLLTTLSERLMSTFRPGRKPG